MSPRRGATNSPLVGAPVRVLLLWCPSWSVAAARSAHGIAADAELALVDKGVIVACSAAAEREGVTTGLRLRQAQHRCPDMVVLPHDPDVDQRVFEPLVRTIEDVVPGVHLIRPGVAAVRAQGASRFYGGDREAAEVLLAKVRSHHEHDVRLAVADGLFAAEQAAHATTPDKPVAVVPAGGSAEFLAPLPVSTVETVVDAEKMGNLLRRLGIRTLGDLAALPAAEVHARFGADGVRAHHLACGHDLPTLTPREIPTDLSARVELDPGVETEQILAACDPVVDQLLGRLEQDSSVCTAVRVTVHAHDAPSDRVWRHPWHFTATDVLDRVRWQLRDLAGSTAGALRADEGGRDQEVDAVVIGLETVVPAQHQAEGLWGARPDQHVIQAITTLQHRLGHDGVLTATLGGGRLLHERALLRPWGEPAPSAAQRRRDQPWPGHLPGPAPALVFETARAVQLLGADGAPLTVTDRGDLNATPTWLLPHAGRAGRSAGGGRVETTAPGLDTARPGGLAYSTSEEATSTHSTSVAMDRALSILAWAGPWPLRQRWWRRGPAYDRLQIVDEHQRAWLLLHESGHWWAEARYD